LKKLLKNTLDIIFTLLGAALLLLAALAVALNLTLRPYVMRVLSEYLASEVKTAFIYITPAGRIVCVAPSASSQQGEFLSAANAVIKVDVSGIRAGKIFFSDIIFNNPDIRIARGKEGFNIGPMIESVTAPGTGEEKDGYKFAVGRLAFTAGRASFHDKDSGRFFRFDNASLVIDLSGEGTAITLISGFGAHPFTVHARYLKGWKIAAKNSDLPASDVLRIFGVRGDIGGYFGSDIVYEGDFAGRNSLKGNLFLRDVFYSGVGGSGQIYFDGSRFFTEIKGAGNRLSASGSLEDAVLTVDNLFVEHPSFSAEAAGRLTLKDFRMRGQFTGLKIDEQIFRGSLSGRIECDGDWSELKLLNARVMLTEGAGAFSKLSMLYNILQTMDVFKYLTGRFPSYEAHFPVKSVSGEIVKKGPVIHAKDVMIENDHSRTSVYGDVDLDKNTIDIVVGFQAQKFINDVISKIPLVGYVLLGEKKSLLPVFVKVKGPLSSPRTSAMPAKTITGPLTGIVERVFKIPFRVFSESKKDD